MRKKQNVRNVGFVLTARALLKLALICAMAIGVLCSHWDHHHEHDFEHHDGQYHERFDEAAIRNEDERHYHQEEYAEYATRYAETTREHRHDHYEAMRRSEEQLHERHETHRENHWNSRAFIPKNAKSRVLDARRANRFLKIRRFVR
ncbi:histidine-rich glycoprotein-like [Rhopilema esculentum]|uniref:histidine-rich glycoprotein-like n=1 Tax=Rhopilema esculentum TaxID=499914 RepID=UPI0031DF53A0